MMGPYLFGTFPEMQTQFRYSENPERARERLAQLVRYHMQDKLRIDTRDYEQEMPGALWYIAEVMEGRYEFDWRGYRRVNDEIEDNWAGVYFDVRRKLQWRLAHPYYAPYYTREFGYRPLPGNEMDQEVMSFYPANTEKYKNWLV